MHWGEIIYNLSWSRVLIPTPSQVVCEVLELGWEGKELGGKLEITLIA